MTLFEYLAVSFSVVLSFAVVRILNGISDVFARPRVYWIHAAWVIHKLLFLAYTWWNIWSYREVSWNFLTFLAVLASPSVLYYQASTLVPAQPGSVASWRDHFYAVRQQFFGAEIGVVTAHRFQHHFHHQRARALLGAYYAIDRLVDRDRRSVDEPPLGSRRTRVAHAPLVAASDPCSSSSRVRWLRTEAARWRSAEIRAAQFRRPRPRLTRCMLDRA